MIDQPIAERRHQRVTALTLLASVLSGSTVSACAAFNPEFTIRVDTLSVEASDIAGRVSIRAVGFGNSGCIVLRRVERSARRDTLVRRLVGKSDASFNTDCTLVPVKFVHHELVVAQSGTSVVVAVKQPDGSLLSRTMLVP